MRRDLKRLADECFDLLVIGGGITGAAIARDAALRGLLVALVEKDDFAGATSAHNSKLIHGGLRYLRNREFGLVRESLRERRIWQRIAPHLVRPLPFLIPVFDDGLRTRLVLGAGLGLYDLLSFDRGWLADPDQRLPGHAWLDRRAAIAAEPALASRNLAGAFRYYDAQMYSPERLALECVLDAADNGAVPANHLAAQSLLRRGDSVEGASVRDTITGDVFDVRASLTIVAVGPWADQFLSGRLHGQHRLLLSKGIHLVMAQRMHGHALTVAAEHGHFFVLPWRNSTILGTTDTPFDGNADCVSVDETEIETFLAGVNTHLPAAAFERSQLRATYAGLRPLVADGSHDTYDASRHAELTDHARRDRVTGLISAIGGKWTTSRHLAEKVVDMASAKLGRRVERSSTANRRLPGAVDRITQWPAGAEAFPDPGRLARLYGARIPALTALATKQPALGLPMGMRGDIGAQVILAIREEMALTLEDVVMRRTGIGQEGHPGPDTLEAVATIVASELGWSEIRKRAEIDALVPFFRTSRSDT